MLKKLAFAVLVLSLAGGVARAQEAEAEEVRPQPVRKIKVLENPYDIASFYRSRQGEYFGLASDARYPIAGFYRSRQTTPYGYAPFWNHGYGYRRGGVAGCVPRPGGGDGRPVLVSPAVLAPHVPPH